MKKVVIFGGGDQARTAFVYLSKDSPYEVAAFTAHERYLNEEKLLGLNIVPFERLEEFYPPDRFAMFIAMGYAQVNRDRANAYNDARSKGYELISYVSSKVTHWGEITIGENCFVLENTVIQPFTHIGNDVVIGPNATIGHDVVIGDHCFVAPGTVITGHVTIGPYCFIGASAIIRNSVTIAPECTIGAGALIMKDTKQQEVYLVKGTEPAPTTSAEFSPFLGFAKLRR